MNLYLLSQNSNDDYDTYDSCVVAAESAERAKLMHPGGGPLGEWDNSWVPPDRVEVKLIGVAESGPERVICSSFKAG